MKTILIIISLFFSVPSKFTIQENVELIEINHYYDKDTGKHMYDQVLIWEFCATKKDFIIRDWFLINEYTNPVLTKVKDQYVMTLYIKDKKNFLQVKSPFFRETFTVVDPERKNRKVVKEDDRRSIFK